VQQRPEVVNPIDSHVVTWIADGKLPRMWANGICGYTQVRSTYERHKGAVSLDGEKRPKGPDGG
jgi:hypothetical protein